jgi:hypothetical protein
MENAHAAASGAIAIAGRGANLVWFTIIMISSATR